jgi:inosine-uridine nucleoside N-ribohydrolase
MRMLLISILLNILMSPTVFSDPGKTRFHVIIDTDGGMDDLRAICMMLSWKEFEVLAITTSNGICSSEQAYHKVAGLLEHFGHQGIPVGMGNKMDIGREPCMERVGKLPWAASGGGNIKEPNDAVELISETLEKEDQPVYFLGLGPLTNLSAFLTEHKNSNIRLVWLNEDPTLSGGTNYDFDKEAAKFVSTNIDNMIIVTPPSEAISLNSQFTKGGYCCFYVQ